MYFGASFPYCSSSLMIAEPTMAPSEIFAIFFACSGVEIPTACRNHAGNLQWGYSKLLGAGYATIVLKTPYRNPLWKRKDSFDVISSVKGASKKRPWQKYTFYQGRTKHLSAVPPWFTAWPVHLAGYQHIPDIYTPAYSVAEYSGLLHLTAPSAVHLTTCFLPDSQQHRLSVKASLSPRKTNDPIPQRKQVSAPLRLLLSRLRAAEPVFEISVAERR